MKFENVAFEQRLDVLLESCKPKRAVPNSSLGFRIMNKVLNPTHDLANNRDEVEQHS